MSSLTNCSFCDCGIDMNGNPYYPYGGVTICEGCYDDTDWYEEAAEVMEDLQETKNKLHLAEKELESLRSIKELTDCRKSLKEIKALHECIDMIPWVPGTLGKIESMDFPELTKKQTEDLIEMNYWVGAITRFGYDWFLKTFDEAYPGGRPENDK